MADQGRHIPNAPSKNELLKAGSHGLRGTIAGDLATPADSVSGGTANLLKFHGVYQQDDRDKRHELRQAGAGGREHSFMVRTKLPGGVLPGEAYLELDRLAGEYANGTLRITTRQGIQFHGVLKCDLQRTLQAMNQTLITTLGACGDVVRNVCTCPALTPENVRLQLAATARMISDQFLPRTAAYAELFVDGEPYPGGEAPTSGAEEPFYGAAYLPRKFKIGLALPHDNCIDVHTNDLGLLAVLDQGELAGWDVLVGGGLGMSFGVRTTYPRLASPVAFVRPEELPEMLTAIVGLQRDYGNRSDRKHARLKYLIDDWGVERFRVELADRLGRAVPCATGVEVGAIEDHLGWSEQADERLSLGLHVENGRIRDGETVRLRSALRLIIERYHVDIRLTPQQNLLLTNIERAKRGAITRLLRKHGASAAPPLAMRRAAMACPALPTCGLAVADAERALPAVVDELENLLIELNLDQEALSVRMTGCPNGCARPWVADIGFVGRTAGAYNVYLGGNPLGTRLNTLVAELVPEDQLVETLRPLLTEYSRARQPEESFGDFYLRSREVPQATEPVAVG